MPRQRIWWGLLALCAGPLGLLAQAQPPAADPVKAPAQPSAALLEFIGDWNETERQLIGMEIQVKKSTPQQNPNEVRRAR